MKKVFISQPMHGRSMQDIQKERARIREQAKLLLGDEVEVLESFFEDVAPGVAPLACLGRGLMLLAQADAVFFAPGWEKSRGCKIEHTCAFEYGVDFICDDCDDTDIEA